jgi:peptidoglycan/xylan/chitin deacetylase (PgdA/CDA1 family)
MKLPRLDRLATVAVIHPFRRVVQTLLGFPRTPAVSRLPILMYHSVSEDAESGVAPFYRTTTSPERFAEQMEFLHAGGWRGVTLAEGLRALTAGKPVAEKLVAITFDDGFHDFLTAAAPELRRRGFSATMYLPTALIAQQGRRNCFVGRQCLDWAEVLELHKCGFEFGSHTVHHPKLVDLPWSEIESELTASKSTIENKLGCPVPAFAYPFAFPQANAPFAARFRDSLTAAGYESCVTTQIGRARPGDNRLHLKRLPVNDADDLRLLAAKMDGAYDWVSWPQRAAKFLKTFRR